MQILQAVRSAYRRSLYNDTRHSERVESTIERVWLLGNYFSINLILENASGDKNVNYRGNSTVRQA